MKNYQHQEKASMNKDDKLKKAKSEVLENLVRSFKSDSQEILCRRCKTLWTPGAWNLYDLCDSCFDEYNAQKMRGRLGGGDVAYYESCNEWIEANKVKEC